MANGDGTTALALQEILEKHLGQDHDYLETSRLLNAALSKAGLTISRMPVEKFLTADSFPQPDGIPAICTDQSFIEYLGDPITRGINEIRVGGIPWDYVERDPGPGEWTINNGRIILGADTLGGVVVGYRRR